QLDVFSDNLSVDAAVGSSLVFAGANAGHNRLVSFDLDQWAFHDITPASELEIYSITAETATTALFDGLRFSDNKVVVGRIDVATGQVTVLSTLPSKWNEFQTF